MGKVLSASIGATVSCYDFFFFISCPFVGVQQTLTIFHTVWQRSNTLPSCYCLPFNNREEKFSSIVFMNDNYCYMLMPNFLDSEWYSHNSGVECGSERTWYPLSLSVNLVTWYTMGTLDCFVRSFIQRWSQYLQTILLRNGSRKSMQITYVPRQTKNGKIASSVMLRSNMIFVQSASLTNLYSSNY